MPPAISEPPVATKNETEERLLDAALTLFAAKGFAATSVREIIEAVGVTRPVLYYYCEGKQDLFERVVRWKHDDAYEQLAGSLTATKGTTNRLRAIIRGTFAFCANDPRVPQLMFQTTFGPVVSELSEFLQEIAERRFAIVADVMREGLAAGELQGGNETALALLFCSLMDYHANLLSRFPDPQRRLTPELADALVNAFLNGVATERGATPQIPMSF
ncbi:MAG: TetR/AcrR family transcriptional regulator [Planctomycetota bacterium]|nr:MAG: TetR/AcrR family transcriptional regulator [Planctomycetota bacterium]REJ94681.1 MAG: TetR/AcrR family transcriptional regulator [Planctomycetota bacterium]REK31359.1 MAG: TetR/AcrR family transcriptional regulator [Planctomycetota bacterium]REK39084.1 MAG: TetR/AcrR family transcriptional regulator [Planctomycetota bacterium]